MPNLKWLQKFHRSRKRRILTLLGISLVVIVIIVMFLFGPIFQTKLNSAQSIAIDPTSPPTLTENELLIPAIGLRAPILWADPQNPQDLNQLLQSGVVQLPGSGLPGQDQPTILLGHSSDFWWHPGGYQTVFINLNRLEQGQKIFLSDRKNQFSYTVSHLEHAHPHQLASFFKNTNQQNLILVTCWPIGTNLARLIIFAAPI